MVILTEEYRFFNHVDNDRQYNADEFAEYFRSILTDGIFNGGTNLEVYYSGTDRIARIKAGIAWIQGYFYKNTDELQLTHDVAHGTYDRIDRIVLRLDKDPANRHIKAFIKTGVAASSPVAPALTRNDTVYEMSLAQVLIKYNTSTIPTNNVTDERLDNSVCGLVNSLVQVDTAHMQTEFDTFMDSLAGQGYASQSALDSLAGVGRTTETVKANADDIGSLNTQMSDLASTVLNKGASMIGIHDASGNFVATDVEGALGELFQSVSNGKNEIATAITDTDPNVTVTGSDTFTLLANGIRSINTGKKWASGTSAANSAVNISGLDFTPKTVIARTYNPSFPHNMYLIIYSEYAQFTYNNVVLNLTGSSYPTSPSILNDNGITITADGFTIGNENTSGDWYWIAYE